MPTLPTHMPPLAALRAFEAVARLGSLSRAAAGSMSPRAPSAINCARWRPTWA
ncbi:hypothetical protein WJ972_02175 [Achromobacter insuavis]